MKIKINGINRQNNAVGNCDEIINLRNNKGEWEVKGQKPELYDVSSIIGEYELTHWYRHPVTPEGWFVCYQPASGMVVTVKSTVPTSTLIHLIPLPEVVTKIYHFGYILIVTTDLDVYYFKFDGDTNTYTLLPKLEHGMYSVSSTNQRQLLLGNVSVAGTGLTTGEEDIVQNYETFEEAIPAMSAKINEYEKLGYCNGHTYFRVAFKMFDGSIIIPTGFIYNNIGMTGWLTYDSYTEDLTPRLILYDNVYTKDVIEIKIPFFAKPLIKLGFTAEQISTLQAYDGLIKSVVVYMTKPYNDRDFNVEKDDLLLITAKDYDVGGITYNGKLYVYPYKDNSTLNESVKETATFYQVHEEAVSNLEEDMSITIEAGDISNIESNSVLPVDDFTSYSIIGDVIYEYNSRLHLADLKIKMNGGYNMSYMENNKFVIPPSTSDIFTPFTDMEDPIYIGTELPTGFGDDIYTIVTLKINNKTKKVINKYDRLAVYKNTSVGTKRYILLNSVQSYPDTRATSIQYVVYYNGEYLDISGVIDLVPHEYLNIAYSNNEAVKYEGTYINDAGTSVANEYIGVRVFRFRKYELVLTGDVVTFTEDNYYTDTNRVQVSKLSNPFYYPAENSYRVGELTNEIVSIMSQAQPLSEGQFGMFPLYVFTTNGIYTLEQGTGDVLYQSIQPVSLDIAVGDAKPVLNGIVFPSKKGLMVLSGRNATCISEPLHGEPYWSNGYEYLNDILNGTNDVVELFDNLSSKNFLTFLEDCIISYDYNKDEIVVSSTKKTDGEFDYKYSYVYSIKTQHWYKSSEYFQEFFSNFAYLDGVIYDLTEEDDNFTPIVLKTAPFTFDKLVSFQRLATRYHKKYTRTEPIRIGDPQFAFYLYGSLDGMNFKLINGIRGDAYGIQNRDVMLKHARTTAKWFVIVFATKTYKGVIDEFEADIVEKYANRIR